MSEYINENNIIQEIMGQSRHQFIYRSDNYPTNRLIEKIENQYPLFFDTNNPICINVKNYGLLETNNLIKNNSDINRACNIFFTCSIAYEIVEKIIKLSETEANDRLERLMFLINKYFLNNKSHKIKDKVDLLKVLKQSMEYYKYNFRGDTLPPAGVLLYIRPDFLIEELKNAINGSSYFGIIIDNKNNISKESTKIINSFINSRINSDISIKILTSPGKWKTYTTPTGRYIESVHDYGIVELDDSYDEYIKSLKRNQE